MLHPMAIRVRLFLFFFLIPLQVRFFPSHHGSLLQAILRLLEDSVSEMQTHNYHSFELSERSQDVFARS